MHSEDSILTDSINTPELDTSLEEVDAMSSSVQTFPTQYCL